LDSTLRWTPYPPKSCKERLIFLCRAPSHAVCTPAKTQSRCYPVWQVSIPTKSSPISNRQGRKTATGERFTANQVGSLRRYRGIPRFQPPAQPSLGEVVPIRKAAQILGTNTSTIHRWLAAGFIAVEQVTPGAPWQIRISEELRARIVERAPLECLPMLEATMKLGVSRQTVLQRVKRGGLQAMLVTSGRRKGLRIRVVDDSPMLFATTS
jgi:transposase